MDSGGSCQRGSLAHGCYRMGERAHALGEIEYLRQAATPWFQVRVSYPGAPWITFSDPVALLKETEGRYK